MKFAYTLLPILALFAAIITLNSCQEEDKTEEELHLDMLKGTWTLDAAVNGEVNGGTDRTKEFVNMKITFGGTYSPGGIYNLATNADQMPSDGPWKANETWKFNTSYVRGQFNLQSDQRLVQYHFFDYPSTNHPKFLSLLIDYDVTGTGRTWYLSLTRND